MFMVFIKIKNKKLIRFFSFISISEGSSYIKQNKKCSQCLLLRCKNVNISVKNVQKNR